EVDADVGLAGLVYEGQRGVEAGAKGVLAAKFQSQAHVAAGRPLRRLGKRNGSALESRRLRRGGVIGGDEQRGNFELLAQFETAAKVVEMSPPLFALRQQQAALVSR